MDQNKVCRMSTLFEKMVSEHANSKEECELKLLYEEFIEDGRNARLSANTGKHKHSSNNYAKH